MKLSNLINEAWLTDEEVKAKLTNEDKKAFIEAVSNFNSFNKSIYRESDLKKVTNAIKELCGQAKEITLGESENWTEGAILTDFEIIYLCIFFKGKIKKASFF